MPQRYDLATLDLPILALYAVAMLAIAFAVGRKKRDLEGFLLAGRHSVWPVVGFSMMAVNLSGTSYVGLAGAGYEGGISVWNYEWIATLVLVFFALVILPLSAHARIDRPGAARETLRPPHALCILHLHGVRGSVRGVLFPEASLALLIASVAVLGALYVVVGGLSAVHITDHDPGRVAPGRRSLPVLHRPARRGGRTIVSIARGSSP